MKSKAPLVLIEQLVMIAVFALAAALCLRIFVWTDIRSSRNETSDKAVIMAQSAAEAIKYSGGDTEHALLEAAKMLDAQYSEGEMCLVYDQDSESDTEYRLIAKGEDSETPYLSKALITVNEVTADLNREIFRLKISWQSGVTDDE